MDKDQKQRLVSLLLPRASGRGWRRGARPFARSCALLAGHGAGALGLALRQAHRERGVDGCEQRAESKEQFLFFFLVHLIPLPLCAPLPPSHSQWTIE